MKSTAGLLPIIKKLQENINNFCKSSYQGTLRREIDEKIGGRVLPTDPAWWTKILTQDDIDHIQFASNLSNLVILTSTRLAMPSASAYDTPLIISLATICSSNLGECGEMTDFAVYKLLLKAVKDKDINLAQNIYKIKLQHRTIEKNDHTFIIITNSGDIKRSFAKNGFEFFQTLDPNSIIWDPLLNKVCTQQEFYDDTEAREYFATLKLNEQETSVALHQTSDLGILEYNLNYISSEYQKISAQIKPRLILDSLLILKRTSAVLESLPQTAKRDLYLEKIKEGIESFRAKHLSITTAAKPTPPR